MDSPKVSVVIPTYNRPEFLRAALLSLCRQEGVTFDVVVVNDAGQSVADLVSTFNSQLAVTYVALDSNSGLPAARNAGIRLSHGSYIAYLDDDDLHAPRHLARLAEHLDARPDIGLVYSDALLARQQLVGEEYQTVAERVLAQEFDHTMMLHDSFICPSTVMHRRECVDLLGGFDETMRWCYEDWDFFLKINSYFKIARVPGATATISLRDNGSNMSSTQNSMRKFAADLLRERYGVGDIEPKTFWEVAETLDELRTAGTEVSQSPVSTARLD